MPTHALARRLRPVPCDQPVNINRCSSTLDLAQYNTSWISISGAQTSGILTMEFFHLLLSLSNCFQAVILFPILLHELNSSSITTNTRYMPFSFRCACSHLLVCLASPILLFSPQVKQRPLCTCSAVSAVVRFPEHITAFLLVIL